MAPPNIPRRIMTFAQYRRLLLVLLLPLLGAGVWLAGSERLFDTHYLIHCDERAPRCRGLELGQHQYGEQRYLQGGVWLNNFARLEFGFSAEVIPLRIQGDAAAASDFSVEPVGDGTRHLSIPADIGTGEAEGGCVLIQTEGWGGGQIIGWSLTCRQTASTVDRLDTLFRFRHPEDEARYLNIIEQAREQDSLAQYRISWLKLAAGLAPLAAFLVLSLAMWVAVRAARYVVGPDGR